MKVLAIGRGVKPLTDEDRKQIMPKEVPHTLQLYLEGKIEQFFFTEDKPGVVFLMNAASLDEAKATIGALPLAAGGFLAYEFLPVGPAQAARDADPGKVSAGQRAKERREARTRKLTPELARPGRRRRSLSSDDCGRLRIYTRCDRRSALLRRGLLARGEKH